MINQNNRHLTWMTELVKRKNYRKSTHLVAYLLIASQKIRKISGAKNLKLLSIERDILSIAEFLRNFESIELKSFVFFL